MGVNKLFKYTHKVNLISAVNNPLDINLSSLIPKKFLRFKYIYLNLEFNLGNVKYVLFLFNFKSPNFIDLH